MATTLSAGDIAIIGFNYDNPDEFAFVPLVDLSAGTEINFTDNGWQAAGSFRATEGTFTWTAPTPIAAGTVINPTISSILFSASGDQIIAYQGDASNPTFIYALNSEGNPGVWQSDSTSSNTSALPTGLVNGETAVALDEIDNAIYTGITSGSKAELLAAISDQSNWSGSNSTRQTLPTNAFSVSGTGGSNPLINEVYVSHTGTDDTEFIEIFGTPGTSLEGLSFIGIEGDSGSAIGTIDARFDFDATHVIGDNGFFLVGNPTGLTNNYGVTPNADISNNFLENSSSTFALVETSSLSGTSVTGSEGVIDTVALTDGGVGDTFFFDAPIIGPDGPFLPAGARRVTDRVDTDTVADWVISDFFLGADNTPTAGTADVIIPEPTLVPIYTIQGAGHASALDSQTVTTTGIVTAVDTNGFYLQDATGDNDIATSDAIFVFTGSAPGVSVGDELQVEGTVSEFTPGGTSTRNLSTTQISGSPTITTLSTGNALPVATIIGASGRVVPSENIDDDAFASFDPETDGIDFFESLEGMLVTAEDLVAVSGTNQFDEIFAVVNQGANATGISDRGTLNISPDDFNPEKIQIDEDSGIFDFDFPEVNVGDTLGDVTGVVGYGFGNFEIYPTQDFTANIQSAGLQPDSTSLVGTSDQLTVASYNVLNLDPVIEVQANTNGGQSRNVDDDLGNGRFEAIAQQIVSNLNAPDIIGLQEIQDNTGGEIVDDIIAADVTLQTLIDAIAAAGGPTYEFIDNTFITDEASGGQPGGNIRNAYLYNPDRVDVVDGSVQTISGQGAGEAFEGARLPLVATFDFNGEDITVVNNHFSSKGGSAPILGIEQPFDARQEDVTVNGSLDERQRQSAAVQGFVSGVLAADANANVVVLGDLNEFEFVSPVTGLEDAGLTNLTNTVPENERYTFNFQGNSQSLDHILVSDSLNTTAEFDIVHVNSEFARTSSTASDHDPLLARFTFAPVEPEVFTLELLHAADQEASAAAIQDAPNFSAVLNALRGQDLGNDGLADNTLTLSSGDAIIPGLFFNASEAVFGSAGIADIQIQNELGFQAIALGNHEFDFGTGTLAGLIDGSAPGDLFGQDFTGTDFPYLSANLDFSTDANLAPLAVAGGQAPQANVVTSSTVIDVNGESIGVVGATTPTLGSISNPGDVSIAPAPFGANPTPAELDALAAEIQTEVNVLLATDPSLNKVVLLSHMQQLDIERALAQRLENVDIIVGGGSNTRLFDESDRPRA
ncbi:MAG: endonuclease/exonuclease/phosphatase family protein, partial [Leptolyngbyaceae cyanobacterium]